MDHIITAVVLQKNRKDRVNVYINDKYTLSLPLWAAGDLKKGDFISQERIDELKYLNENDKAFQRAVSYLAVRPRSRKEIVQHLEKKEFSPEAIENTIQRLESYGYINDAEFARLWVENRLRHRPRGIFGLTFELKQKGIREDIIEDVLNGYDEHSAGWAALSPKLEKWRHLQEIECRRKIYNFLNRRGFSSSTIRDICETVMNG
ncbi:MAG: RecX family transcriptional regulator [Desulfobacterales bacterium]|nr:RecX family transcriptional regulator [Desulfobacterales bacterium]